MQINRIEKQTSFKGLKNVMNVERKAFRYGGYVNSVSVNYYPFKNETNNDISEAISKINIFKFDKFINKAGTKIPYYKEVKASRKEKLPFTAKEYANFINGSLDSKQSNKITKCLNKLKINV